MIIPALLLVQCKNTPREAMQTAGRMQMDADKDLLLVQYDCKTDVDDLHSVAAFATLIAQPEFAQIRYHAVAGAYGIQEGLYVPPNELFQLAFGNQWSDAHENAEAAVEKVSALVMETLNNGGDVWIAEAGQSDFSARLIRTLQLEHPDTNLAERINIVQHSDWNEEATSPRSLQFVKENSKYRKIPDGNAVGNGTPGFRTPEFTAWGEKLNDQKILEVWQLAVDLANQYNGADGRYLNEAIAAGGLDFSDLAEVCWILGIEDIHDTEDFFRRYGN